MRFGRTSAPRHPSRCSGCVSIRWGCRCERSLRCSSGSTLTVPTEPSGTGRIRFRRLRLTRRRGSRRGSLSTRNRSRSTVRKSGSTRQSTRIRSYRGDRHRPLRDLAVTDQSGFDAKRALDSLGPLVEQVATVDQHERATVERVDEPEADHRFARAGRE